MILNGPLESMPLRGRFDVVIFYFFMEYMVIFGVTIPFLYRYFTLCR